MTHIKRRADGHGVKNIVINKDMRPLGTTEYSASVSCAIYTNKNYPSETQSNLFLLRLLVFVG